METTAADRRMLLVHAHPDDESIGTGATMARYAAAGVQVTLVTCTLGEEGEILLPSLAQLEAAQADQLGGVRIGELDNATRALGVGDHRFLGGAGRFRDSGMLGTAANTKPRSFWSADTDKAVFQAAVAALVEVIREVRPQVVLSYDDVGGYGHPDHLMAHRVTTEAVRAAARGIEPADAASSSRGYPDSGLPPWTVAKFYWTAVPKSALAQEIETLAAAGRVSGTGWPPVDDIAFVVDDSLVTTAIDAREFGPAKRAALAAHATQITVDDEYFALSDGVWRASSGVEYYRLISGELGRDRDADGRETDLFDGIGEKTGQSAL